MRFRSLLLIVIAGGGALLAFLYLETGLMQVVGVDVSHHQKSIDWPALARSGVAFAYIKATEGGDYVDDRFAQNWREAGAAGLPRGAYHYFRQCRPAAVQAKNFIAAVPKDARALPAVVDVEDMEICGPAVGVASPDVEVSKFLDLVEAHFGCRPIIYTTNEYDSAFFEGKFGSERFWVRSIFAPPFFRIGSWTFWQYHNAGRRPGVDGAVDLNAFRGTAVDFQRFAAGGGCGRERGAPAAPSPLAAAVHRHMPKRTAAGPKSGVGQAADIGLVGIAVKARLREVRRCPHQRDGARRRPGMGGVELGLGRAAHALKADQVAIKRSIRIIGRSGGVRWDKSKGCESCGGDAGEDLRKTDTIDQHEPDSIRFY